MINAAGSGPNVAGGRKKVARGMWKVTCRWQLADSRRHLLLGIQPIVQVLIQGDIQKIEKRQGDENRFLFLVKHLIFVAPGVAVVTTEQQVLGAKGLE